MTKNNFERNYLSSVFITCVDVIEKRQISIKFLKVITYDKTKLIFSFFIQLIEFIKETKTVKVLNPKIWIRTVWNNFKILSRLLWRNRFIIYPVLRKNVQLHLFSLCTSFSYTCDKYICCSVLFYSFSIMYKRFVLGLKASNVLLWCIFFL